MQVQVWIVEIESLVAERNKMKGIIYLYEQPGRYADIIDEHYH